MRTTLDNLEIIHHAPYRVSGVGETAYALKDGDISALRTTAASMATLVPGGAVLVPVPSHTGRATHTLALCLAIQRLRGGDVTVLDCLEGNARESFCEAKKAGRTMTEDDFGMRLREGTAVPEGRQLLLVDNVVATGTTARCAARALGREAAVLAYAYDSDCGTSA